MVRKFVIPLLAVAGVAFALYVVKAGMKKPPVAQPVAPPTLSPFGHSIAGAGVVEASTQNIAVGTFVPGVVTDVYATVGSQVKAGDPLFKVDDRDLQAELIVRRAAAVSSEAKVRTAQALYEQAKALLQRYQAIEDPRAVSKEEKDRRFFAAAQTEAQVAQAKADAEGAAAQVKAAETDIARRTVRALVDGEILQVNLRPGEYVMAGLSASPPMVLGATTVLHVRADVDENDAWRLRPDAKAVAAVRGNRELKVGLTFVRVEPYIIPKRSLTGESTERVDTRVLQVLYAFPREALPRVYVGQQMDVWIEAPAADGSGFPATGPTTRPTTGAAGW